MKFSFAVEEEFKVVFIKQWKYDNIGLLIKSKNWQTILFFKIDLVVLYRSKIKALTLKYKSAFNGLFLRHRKTIKPSSGNGY